MLPPSCGPPNRSGQLPDGMEVDDQPDEAIAARIARLSEGQKTCLRQVREHRTSKEIARELGISKHTVDQRLKLAATTLGVAGRTEAALLFARHDPEGVYDRIVYDPVDIAGNPIRNEPIEPEVDAPADPAILPWREGDPTGAAFDTGEARNELSIVQRLAWSAAAILVVIIAAGIFLSGMGALGRLVVAFGDAS